VELVHPDADQVAGDVVLSGQTVETGIAVQVHLDEAQLQFHTVTTVSVGSLASILRRLARWVNSGIDDCLPGGVHSNQHALFGTPWVLPHDSAAGEDLHLPRTAANLHRLVHVGKRHREVCVVAAQAIRIEGDFFQQVSCRSLR
jgi:hypothetical protein